MPIDPDQLLALRAPLGGLLPRSESFYAGMMLVGFLIGMWGRGMDSRLVTSIGIAVIFAAVLVLPIALNVFD